MYLSITTAAGKFVEVESDLTDDQARAALKLLAPKSDFAAKLYHSVWRQPWQRFWAHKLAVDARKRAAEAANPQPEAVLDLLKIAGIFSLVSRGRGTRPIFRALHGETRIQIKPAGPGEPGAFKVTGDGYGHFGKIDAEGNWLPSRGAPQGLGETLAAIANDPLAAAVHYGKMTNACCFCGRVLSNEESVERGFGPICAKTWGLA